MYCPLIEKKPCYVIIYITNSVFTRRLNEAREALQGDSDWTVAQTLFGITTSYRREPDSTLSIKLEGELHDVPLFEQLCVLRETDLFRLWAPFMSQSRKLLQITKIEVRTRSEATGRGLAWGHSATPLTRHCASCFPRSSCHGS